MTEADKWRGLSSRGTLGSVRTLSERVNGSKRGQGRIDRRVGSRVGAVPDDWPVSYPRHLKRSVRISRTPLSCRLRDTGLCDLPHGHRCRDRPSATVTTRIERLNLTIRQGSAYLSRRTLSHARATDTLDAHLELLRCYYNFVRTQPAVHRERFWDTGGSSRNASETTYGDAMAVSGGSTTSSVQPPCTLNGLGQFA